jgi:hypothetical protein
VLTTLSHFIAATVRLNNCGWLSRLLGPCSFHIDLQDRGRLQEISYFERDNGRAAEHRWTVILKSERTVTGS